MTPELSFVHVVPKSPVVTRIPWAIYCGYFCVTCMGKCNGSFIDIYMYMYTSLWCHVNYKFYLHCCSCLLTIIMCCHMKLMLLSGWMENPSPLSQVRSYIRTNEKGYDAQYPTSHYYWILWHIRFRLSISGNPGSKFHCGYGNIVNTPFYIHY